MPTMKTPSSPGTKLAAFGAAVTLVFGATFGVARAMAPDGAADRTAEDHGGGHGSAPPPVADEHGGHGSEKSAPAPDEHGGQTSTKPAAAAPGLAVAEAGYRLVAETTSLASGPAVPFRFRIDGPDGRPVQRYEQLHERELHLIVVRRDLTGFQHVHPARSPDGTWAIDLDLEEGGTWRAFADLAPTGGPAQLTLGVDLQVPGSFTPGTGPAASAPADPALGVSFDRRGDDIEITVRRDGATIEPEPYLGARGHLVALRAGDLAYLHVHPLEGGEPAVRFGAELPTAGSYALFFDYQVGGVVHTATTTIEVQ